MKVKGILLGTILSAALVLPGVVMARGGQNNQPSPPGNNGSQGSNRVCTVVDCSIGADVNLEVSFDLDLSLPNVSPPYDDTAIIVQEGSNQKATIKQYAGTNWALIAQDGANNEAYTTQGGLSGTTRVAMTVQCGNNLDAYVTQRGGNAQAYVFQNGSGHLATVKQY